MYVVEGRIAQDDPNHEAELRTLYFSCVDAVCGDIMEHFAERDCTSMHVLKALDTNDRHFLDVS